MSATTVHNAILDAFQKNSDVATEFATALAGTASSNGTAVTGVDTAFLTAVAAFDPETGVEASYVGNATKGYRRVEAVGSDLALTVNAAFDSNLAGEAIKVIEVKKGFPAGNLSLSQVGKTVRVTYLSSLDIEDNLAKQMGLSSSNTVVYTRYDFLLIAGFMESNPAVADERKGSYDSMIRKVVDNNMTFRTPAGVATCVGISAMGKMNFEEAEESGIYWGVMPLLCFRREVRGTR